jgi:glucokinase
MLLAGDIGGTKTLLGLFEAESPRPRAVAVRSFVTLEYDDLAAIVTEFTRDRAVASGAVEVACFGVAGPVINGTAELTNVPWRVDAPQIAETFGFHRVDLLNDLQAMAYSLTVLDDSEVCVLQDGDAGRGGNIGLIGAGTGLGLAMLHSVDGRYEPMASEGGHADFAARTEREIRLLRWMTERYGRAEVEGVVSGRGLLNIYRVTHDTPCAVDVDLQMPDAAARITMAGLERRCAGCVEALDLFVEAYGAEAGNLALRTVSTGGLFVGGGIAPKILPALTDGRFMRAFRSKAPFEALLSAIAVKVILNPEAALLGAAVYAASRR